MKARKIKTGQVFDVYDITLMRGGMLDTYLAQDIEILQSEPDWNQIKIQASIAAMQGMLANQDWPNSANIADDFDEYTERVSSAAVDFADSLIAELKKQMK
jgi:hypothetical protein